jgi:glycosyltransferase involved in cell wall biosynthesis
MAPIPPNILTTLKANIAALRTVDAGLAARVEAAEWPADVQFIAALDGTPTAFSRQFSSSGWFARTGAPQVREQMVCDHFTVGGANVILPGTGQGWGLRYLLGRFEPQQSIFVWETNRVHLAALLGLYDFSSAISDHRLVFLSEPDLKKALLDFLSAHPEIVLPTKMMNWPWISESEVQHIGRMVEQAVQEHNTAFGRRLSELQDRLNERFAGRSKGGRRRVQIFSLSSQRATYRVARDFARAARKRDWAVDVFLLDRPMHGSSAAIVSRMIDFVPDLIFSIGVERKNWLLRLPKDVRFVSILGLPGVVLGSSLSEDLVPEEGEVFVLGSPADFERLKGKSRVEQLFVMDVAVSPEVFCPCPAEQKRDVQVTVIADRSDPDPEKVGMYQKSHQYLWSQIRQVIEDHPLSYSHARAGNVIQQVSRHTGVTFTDKDVLEKFAKLVKGLLAPAAVSTAIVRSLSGAGLKVRILGRGWEADEEFGELAATIPDEPESLNEIFNSSELVLYVDYESNWRQVVFDAITAGVPVLAKKLPDDPLASMREAAAGITILRPEEDLVAQVRSALGRIPELRGRVRQARKFLEENFSYDLIFDKLLSAQGYRG